MTLFSDIKKKGQKIEFKIKNIDTVYVNAIRRIILSEIPIAAFYFDTYDIEHNDITIIKNTGVLHNEFIAHRISLIPLHFSEEENLKDIKKYKFVLNVKNTTSTVLNVTTKDFEIFYDNQKVTQERKEFILPKNEITQDYILITKLKPNLHNIQNGQELHVECIPSIGIGKEHARWNPTSQCCFYNVVDEEAANKAFENIKKEKNLNEKATEVFRKNFEALEKFKYFKKNKYDEPSEFIFIIESVARLSPLYLFEKALNVLSDKMDKFIENINSFDIQQVGNIQNMYQIGIKDEDHTLLNTLQSAIYNSQIRELKENSPLIYIGYYQPHPLDHLLYLKLKFKEDMDTDIDFLKSYMIERVQDIKIQINKFIEDWQKVAL
jgi:DNA-directed RNA polymerase alpha subunit